MIDENEIKKNITKLLNEWRLGDDDAFNNLMPELYPKLQVLAKQVLKQDKKGRPTELLNAAWINLHKERHKTIVNREHFYRLTAVVMRHTWLNQIKAENALKRGAGFKRVSILDELGQESPDLFLINEAMDALTEKDPKLAQVIDLCYFLGLTIQEVSEEMCISISTAKRKLNLAKAQLRILMTQ